VSDSCPQVPDPAGPLRIRIPVFLMRGSTHLRLLRVVATTLNPAEALGLPQAAQPTSRRVELASAGGGPLAQGIRALLTPVWLIRRSHMAVPRGLLWGDGLGDARLLCVG